MIQYINRDAVKIGKDEKLPITCHIQDIEQFENITYQWYRDGKPIRGAKKDTYFLDDKDYVNKERGILKDISCQVSADLAFSIDEKLSMTDTLQIVVRTRRRRKKAN